MIAMDYLNDCSVDDFVAAVGFAFEDSPWIAEAAAQDRPFADRNAMIAGMVAIVAHATNDAQVALIAAHPDLAGRVAREGRLTASSTSEQARAGLNALTPEEIARFDADNGAYRARFGFPFVICARENTKASILDAITRRGQNDRATEITAALAEIAKIARLRIEDAVS
jgi:2-oxo-4-hydroxy-4-carboxy-5-ureidoimidazoline decarboxylase